MNLAKQKKEKRKEKKKKGGLQQIYFSGSHFNFAGLTMKHKSYTVTTAINVSQHTCTCNTN